MGVVVEGLTDVAAAERILTTCGLRADPHRTVVTNGKARLDARLHAFNRAARVAPWLVLRDADHDGDDCPVQLREQLLPRPMQTPAMCLRLAVRSLETWLLADDDAFAQHFAVPANRVPQQPEVESNPKQALVNACRSSRRRDVRQGVLPPTGSRRLVGPEYTSFITDYCRTAWRPDAAADSAPSLSRALTGIRALVNTGTWT